MRPSNLVLVTALVLGLLTKEASSKADVDNHTLFTLGSLAVAGAVGFYIGQQHGSNRGNRNQNRGFFGGVPLLGRRRRQAEDFPANELDPLVAELFQQVLEKDNNGCSLKLACAIGRNPSEGLTGHAKEFDTVLNKKVSETTPKESRSGVNAFQVARDYGRDGGKCEEIYKGCPNSSGLLMSTFQSM